MSDNQFKSAFTSKTAADIAAASQAHKARKATALYYRKRLEESDQESDAEELKNAINARTPGGSQWWDTKDTALSIGRGISNFGRSTFNLFGSGFGKSAKDLGWEYKESESISGGLVGGITQFMSGFATTKGGFWLGKKGLKAHAEKQLAKGKGAKVDKKFAGTEGASALTWSRVVLQGAAYGAITDFLSFDPDEGNLGTMLLRKAEESRNEETGEYENPKLVAWLKDWVAIDPEEWAKNEQGLTDHFKERFKNVGEGVIMGVGIDSFMRLMKVWHINRGLNKAKTDLLESQKALDDLSSWAAKGNWYKGDLSKSKEWREATKKQLEAAQAFDNTVTEAMKHSVNIESSLHKLTIANKQESSGIGVIGDDIRKGAIDQPSDSDLLKQLRREEEDLHITGKDFGIPADKIQRVINLVRKTSTDEKDQLEKVLDPVTGKELNATELMDEMRATDKEPMTAEHWEEFSERRGYTKSERKAFKQRMKLTQDLLDQGVDQSSLMEFEGMVSGKLEMPPREYLENLRLLKELPEAISSDPKKVKELDKLLDEWDELYDIDFDIKERAYEQGKLDEYLDRGLSMKEIEELEVWQEATPEAKKAFNEVNELFKRKINLSKKFEKLGFKLKTRADDLPELEKELLGYSAAKKSLEKRTSAQGEIFDSPEGARLGEQSELNEHLGIEGKPEVAEVSAVEVDFSTSSNAEVRTHLYRVDPTDGTIGLDLKAIRRDFKSNDPLPYLSGDAVNPVTGAPSSVSINESALFNRLGVDPARLKKRLIQVAGEEGAAEMYKDFFLIRSRNVKALGKDAGLATDQLYMGSARADEVFMQSTFDALFKPVKEGGLGLKPDDVRSVWAGEITPTGHKLDTTRLANLAFKTKGKIEAYNEQIIRAKKGEITLHEVAEMGDLINPDTFTKDRDARTALIALAKTNEDTFATNFEHIDDLATALGWKGPEESLSAEDFVKKDIKDFLGVLRESGSVDSPRMESLEDMLAGGEGIFEGSGLDKIELGAEGVDGLGAVPLTQLSGRIVALRQNLTGRLGAIAKQSEEWAKKLDAGELTDDDRIAFAVLEYGAQRDLARLRLMGRAAGKALRSFQNYDVLMKNLNAEEKELFKEQLIEGAGGRQRIDENIALSAQVHKPEPAAGAPHTLEQRLNAQRVLSDANKTDILHALNDVWINAMLSGLRTHAVNNVSNVIKGTLNLTEQFLGAAVPIFSKAAFRAQEGKQDIFGNFLQLSPDVTKSGKGWTFEGSTESFSTKKQAEDAGRDFMADQAAATAMKFTRGKSVDQLMYSISMGWDILRLFFKNADDGLDADIVTGDALAQQRGRESLESFQFGGQTDADMARANLGGTASEAMDNSSKGAASSHQIMGGLQATARDWGILGTKKPLLWTLNAIEGSTPYKGFASLWDGFYQHFLRQATRKMNFSDQLFKRVHFNAHVHSSLKNHAIHVLGLEGKDVIAKYILDHKRGMMLPNGEVFSEKNLRMSIYKRLGAQVDPKTGEALWQGESRTAEAQRMFDNERHLLDANGNILLTSGERERLATNALDYGNEATFTENLGKVDEEAFGEKGLTARYSNRLGKSDAIGAAGRGLTPFVRTPTNIWRDALSHFPILGTGHRKNIADWDSPDPTRRSSVIGRQMVGSALWAVGAAAVGGGAITGGLSLDRRRRDMQIANGLRPYTITFPNGYKFDFGRIEPLSIPLKWMADYYDTAHFIRNDEKEGTMWADFGQVLVGATVRTMSSSTYTKGIAEGMMLFTTAATSEDERAIDALQKWVNHRAASMIPNALEVANLSKVDREARSLKDLVLKRIWPYGVPPKRDPIFGRIVKIHQSYPNAHIKSITPVKHYRIKPEEIKEIYGVLLSMQSTVGSRSTKLLGYENLKMTEHYADFDFIDVDEKTGTHTLNKKLSKQLRVYAKNFKARGGASCPIFEGQDFYDFVQQYGSVRKVKLDAPQIAAWRDNTPEEFTEADKEHWQKFMNEFEKSVGSREVNLEELLMIAVRSETYKNIPKEHFPELNLKTFRGEFIGMLINDWRRQSLDELLGKDPKTNPEGLIQVNLNKTAEDPKMTYGGALGKFWPNLALMAASKRTIAAYRKNRNAVTEETLLHRQERAINPPKE